MITSILVIESGLEWAQYAVPCFQNGFCPNGLYAGSGLPVYMYC